MNKIALSIVLLIFGTTPTMAGLAELVDSKKSLLCSTSDEIQGYYLTGPKRFDVFKSQQVEPKLLFKYVPTEPTEPWGTYNVLDLQDDGKVLMRGCDVFNRCTYGIDVNYSFRIRPAANGYSAAFYAISLSPGKHTSRFEIILLDCVAID